MNKILSLNLSHPKVCDNYNVTSSSLNSTPTCIYVSYSTLLESNLMRGIFVSPPITSLSIDLNLTRSQTVLQSKWFFNNEHESQTITQNSDFIARIVEGSYICYSAISKAEEKQDILVALVSLYHAISGRSVFGSTYEAFTRIASDVTSDKLGLQSGDWIDLLDEWYEKTTDIRSSVLFKKLNGVFNHVIAHGIYHKMGINFNEELFGKFEREKIIPNCWTRGDFVSNITGLVIYLLKQGRQAMLTGDIECFFVSKSSVSKWMARANTLRKDFEFLSNPAAVGIKLSTYLQQLDVAISEGKNMARAMTNSAYEKNIVNSLVVELELLNKRHMSTMAAATIRWCPVGIFIYGKPGVAKTTINKALFIYYCSVRGIAEEQALMFYKNFEDKYMSGFKSYHVGITFDDVAQHRPDKIIDIDPSLKEIISFLNNTPCVTNQAAAEDKGKVPFLCEYVGVTSNVPDLNLRHYFSEPFAAMRRLGIRIEPVVKPEFRKEGEEFKIDPSKIPAGTFPDCWHFRISYPSEREQAYVFSHVVPDFSMLLKLLHPYFVKHIGQQSELMSRVSQMKPENLCACLMPREICTCTHSIIDSDSTTLEAGGEPTLRDAQGDPTLYTKLLARHRGHNTEVVVQNRFSALASSGTGSIVSVDIASDLTSEMWPDLSDDDISPDDSISCIGETVKVVLTQMPNLNTELAKHNDSIFTALKKDIIKCDKLCSFDLMYVHFWFERNQPDIWAERTSSRVEEYRKAFYAALVSFRRLTVDKKRTLLTGMHVSGVFASRNWLTFSPVISNERGFLNVKLNEIHDRLKIYAPSHWTPAHMACLENYVLEEVPAMLHEDWDSFSIIAAMPDYVLSHVKNFSTHTRHYNNTLLEEWNGVEVTFKQRCIRRILSVYVHQPLVRSFVNWFLTNKSTSGITSRVMDYIVHGNQQHLVVENADRIDRSLGGHPWIIALIAMMSSAALIGVIIGMCKLLKPKTRLERSIKLNEVGQTPKVREGESENVWNIEERVITENDFSPERKRTLTHLQSSMIRNLLFSEISGIEGGRQYRCHTRVVVIDNNTVLINSHAMTTPCKITLYLSTKIPSGVMGTVVLDVTEDMVTRNQQNDVALIHTNGLPALFKDIRPNFKSPNFTATFDGYHLTKMQDGKLRVERVAGVQMITYREHNIKCDAYTGMMEEKTENGDCGSLLVLDTGYGPVIVGMHVARFRGSKKIVCVSIDNSMFDTKRTIVQCSSFDSITELTQESKLFTDFYPDGTMLVHGATTGFRARNKTRANYSECAKWLFQHGHEYGHNIVDRMRPPPMHSWKPQQIALKEYLKPTHSMDEGRIRKCREIFSQYISNNLTSIDREDIHVVNMDIAVNGYPGVPNVDAQKFSTSAGFGFPGSKSKYSSISEYDVWTTFRDYNDELTNKMESMFDNYKRGIRNHPVFMAQLKDEHVSVKKFHAGKVRVFFMCPVTYLSLIRMYTLGMSRVMMRRKDIFKTAVGLNTHSEEWNTQYVRFTRHGVNNCVAGDFVGYDKVLSLLISNTAADFFLDVASFGNFTEEDKLVFKTLLADFISPTVDYFGTFITLLGGEVSGHQLTTFFNSAANVLLHMYAYETLYPDGKFFEYVDICTLGDDVKLCVSSVRPNYNHTTIQKVFSDIGIQYTMADKESESVPYIHVDEVTFLKRTYKHGHDVIPLTVAPIEKESIYKMLCYTIQSKTISPSYQLAQAIGCAVRESFYHAPCFRKSLREMIRQMPKSFELIEALKLYPIPQEAAICAGFIKASPNFMASVQGQVLLERTNQIEHFHDSNYSPSNESIDDEGVDRERFPTKDYSPQVPIKGCAGLDALMTQTSHVIGADHESHTSSTNTQTIMEVSEMRDTNKTILQSTPFSSSISDVPETMSESITTHTQQVSFVNEPEGECNDISAPFTSLGGEQKISADLGDFLKRPVKIFAYQWLENDTPGFKVEFAPHTTYFNEPAIKNKLDNFGLMRCNLKIKIMINSSPFYYGRLGAFMKPLSEYITDLVISNDLGQCQISALPHVWIDPQATSNTEMVLPFLYPLPWVNTNFLANLDLARIELWQFAALRSANGATLASGVDVTVYAWCEDVELAGYTGVTVLQSNKEYLDDHQISQSATAVAGVASKLKNVPVVGPFATATETAAKGIASVASALGFTNVPNINDVQPMKQMPFNLATTSISEPTQKLSVDPKQEISLDRKIFGDKTDDPLLIKNFTGREVFLCGTLWETTAAPETRLFSSAVVPSLYLRNTDGNAVAHTPMSYCSQMFQYWRGSIIFRFKVIRSQYHRGRLHLAWDMNAKNITGVPNINSSGPRVAILDLDESDEVEMEIPYCQAKQFLEIDPLATGPAGRYWENGTGTPLFPTGTQSNGVIQLRVLNRMTAPTTTSDVNVLVFVRAGSDFELAAPRGLPTFISHSNLDNTILQSSKTYLGDGGENRNLNKVMFGEKIVSLREVLHRQTLSFTHLPTSEVGVVGFTNIVVPIKRYPLPPGPFNNGWHAKKVNGAVADCRVNLSFMTPINWLAPCFVGVKGSVNLSVNVSTGDKDVVDSFALSRWENGSYLTNAQRRPDYWSLAESATTTTNAIVMLNTARFGGTGFSGRALTNQHTNAGLTANLPYYSDSGFNLSDPFIQYSNAGSITDINDDWFRIDTRVFNDTTTLKRTAIDVYYGAGPDFDLTFFTYIPIVYYNTYS